MATLDERIGLSFDEDEARQRAGTLPAVAPEAATPVADGAATLIDQPLATSEPASAPAPAPPVEPAEPKKLSPAADTPEGFDMPVVTKVEQPVSPPPPPPAPAQRPHGLWGASREKAKQREAREERATADERQALSNAAAFAMMTRDASRDDRIVEIMRAMPKETLGDIELVRRNFLAYDAEYRLKQQREAENQRSEEQRQRQAGQLHDLYDASRSFDVLPEVLAPDFKPLKDILTEQQQQLGIYYNDQSYGKLSSPEQAANQIERRTLEISSGTAIAGIAQAERFRRDNGAIKARILNGEPLTGPDRLRFENSDIAQTNTGAAIDRGLAILAESQARLAQLPQSPALRKLGEAKTIGGFLEVLRKHGPEIAMLGVADSVPSLAAGAGGTLLGGPLGGILASGTVTFGSEFSTAIVKGFERRKINLQDQAAVLAVIRNPTEMQAIYNEALIAAGIATLADVTTGVVSGKSLTSVRQGLLRPVAETGAQFIVQGGIGFTQELATGIIVENKLPTIGKLGGAFFQGGVGALVDQAISGTGSAIKYGAVKAKPHVRSFVRGLNPPAPPLHPNQQIVQQTNLAQNGIRSAAALAHDIRLEQKIMAGPIDPRARKETVKGSIDGQQTLYVPWEAVVELREKKILTEDLMAELDVTRQLDETERVGGLVTINKATLLTSGLKTEHIDEVSRNVRTEPNGKTAREADVYLGWRKAQLSKMVQTFEASGKTRPDGWAVYRYFLHNEAPGKRPEAARLAAAAKAEQFINLALTTPGETANGIFMRDYPRFRQVPF